MPAPTPLLAEEVKRLKKGLCACGCGKPCTAKEDPYREDGFSGSRWHANACRRRVYKRRKKSGRVVGQEHRNRITAIKAAAKHADALCDARASAREQAGVAQHAAEACAALLAGKEAPKYQRAEYRGTYGVWDTSWSSVYVLEEQARIWLAMDPDEAGLSDEQRHERGVFRNTLRKHYSWGVPTAEALVAAREAAPQMTLGWWLTRISAVALQAGVVMPDGGPPVVPVRKPTKSGVSADGGCTAAHWAGRQHVLSGATTGGNPYDSGHQLREWEHWEAGRINGIELLEVAQDAGVLSVPADRPLPFTAPTPEALDALQDAAEEYALDGRPDGWTFTSCAMCAGRVLVNSKGRIQKHRDDATGEECIESGHTLTDGARAAS